jgi:Fe-S cluster biogenesis protein NfuA
MTSPLAEMEQRLRLVAAPLIARDGGRLYLVRLTEEQVSLHLAGRYAGAPGAHLVLERILVPLIRAISPTIQVAMTSGWSPPSGAIPLT